MWHLDRSQAYVGKSCAGGQNRVGVCGTGDRGPRGQCGTAIEFQLARNASDKRHVIHSHSD